MEFLPYIAFIFMGILAGILAGLLGISGGVITVPCLALFFHLMSFPQAYVMHLAIGTSLAAMVFSGLGAAWSHHIKKAVIWDIVWAMFPGIIIGSIIGSLIAHVLSSVILAIFFGFFAILLGIYFYRKRFIAKQKEKKINKSRSLWLGFGISGLANILGIGGGVMTVPILVAHNYPEKKAVGTSAAIGLLISFLGALAYLYFGMKEIQIEYGIGYLYLPAFIVIGIVSFFCAPLGTKWAHGLPVQTIRRIFGVFLVISGLLMIFI